MRKVERIVWHTAAHGDFATRKVYDTTAAQIDRWHKERGWDGIGYNVVIRFDGTIEQGRDPNKIPAAVVGLNATTYHVCFSGHGDIAPLTPAQVDAGVRHTIEMLEKYNLKEAFLTQRDALIVMGHREVNELVRRGLASVPTSKTCPGRLVDMEHMRSLIRAELTSNTVLTVYDREKVHKLYRALREVYAQATLLGISEDSLHYLNQFRKQKDVDALIQRYLSDTL